MHGVEVSAIKAGRTQEVWTVPGPRALWEFCFGKEDDSVFCFDGHCTEKLRRRLCIMTVGKK